MSDVRRAARAESAANARSPERRRFLTALLGLGALGLAAADPATAKPVEAALDGGRP